MTARTDAAAPVACGAIALGSGAASFAVVNAGRSLTLCDSAPSGRRTPGRWPIPALLGDSMLISAVAGFRDHVNPEGGS